MNGNDILVDTGALLASINRRDKYHRQATQFFNSHRSSTYHLSELIFAETLTLSKSRLGPRMAILLGERLRQSPQFKIHPSDIEQCWAIYARYDDKEWSFADCSILQLAHTLNVWTVFGFDRHLSQMAELTRLP